MHKGYALEHDIEQYFLDVDGKTRDMAIIGETGHIQRTFRVPNSGALAALKGDVRTSIPWLPQQIMVECKHRRCRLAGNKMAYHMDMTVVQKNIDEADAAGMMPVFVFAFKGAMKNRIQAILRTKDWEKLSDKFPPRPGCAHLELKKNKTTYTILKDDVDAKGSNGLHPLYFYNGDQQFYLVSWSVMDAVFNSLRGTHAVQKPTA